MISSRGAASLLLLACLMAFSVNGKAIAALGANPEIDQDIQKDEEAALKDREKQDSESNPPPVNFAQEYEKDLYGYGTNENDKGRGTNNGRMYSDSGSSTLRNFASTSGTPEQYLKIKDGSLSCKFEKNNQASDTGFTKISYTVPRPTKPSSGIGSFLELFLASYVPDLPGSLGSVVPGATGAMPKKIGEVTAGTRSKPGQVLGLAQPSLLRSASVANKINSKRNEWSLDDPQNAVQARKNPQQPLNSGKPAGSIKDNDDNGNCQERAGQTGSCNGG